MLRVATVTTVTSPRIPEAASASMSKNTISIPAIETDFFLVHARATWVTGTAIEAASVELGTTHRRRLLHRPPPSRLRPPFSPAAFSNVRRALLNLLAVALRPLSTMLSSHGSSSLLIKCNSNSTSCYCDSTTFATDTVNCILE